MSKTSRDPIDAPYALRPGATVAWRENRERRQGRILFVHSGYVARDIDGETVERWGSEARPVIEAEMPGGEIRLLLVSDLLPLQSD